MFSCLLLCQIDFEKRKDDEILNDCLMSVDSTDFLIVWFAQVCGQIVTSVQAQHLHLHWPPGMNLNPAGKFNDITVFNQVLVNFLDPYKRIETDSGYRRHPRYIKCPENGANPPKNLAMQGRMRSRHETFNGHLKNWGILFQVFC